MIIGSLVLPSIGGGVCQTATTLFNDAFEIGLPILERTNHNLYLSHYPLGRDATVSWGGPDFKFKNDLTHGILITTSYTDSTLTFTFYGTNEHRRVVAKTSPQKNWSGPSMNYAVDPNAARGSVKVVSGTGEKGFDVTVDRTVYDASGRELRHNVFQSHYILTARRRCTARPDAARPVHRAAVDDLTGSSLTPSDSIRFRQRSAVRSARARSARPRPRRVGEPQELEVGR
jgi:hypothetical protein